MAEWNPNMDIWPVGSCAYGSTKCAPGIDPEESRSMFNLLEIVNSSNVSISGNGGIVGNGLAFWKVRVGLPEVRAYCLLRIYESSDIHVRDLHLKDSPMYHVSIPWSQRVHLSGVRVEFSGDFPVMQRMNTDGVSIGPGSQYVTLRHSKIASGDDNIVVKRGSSFVEVSDVSLRHGKGISIGSLGERQSEGSVTSCRFERVSYFKSQHGARIKTWRGGRGLVSNLTFSDLVCDRVGVGVLVDQEYCPPSQRPDGCLNEQGSVHLENIRFEKVTGTFSREQKSLRCIGSKDCNLDMSSVSLSYAA
eukprot:TRINITY_DN60023_c0_g1_i1.p1 TRINITY_DN60023_c0_g1~~TRINITY_DN60023_c0_g1_i1.p1  ORF type:complete len:353 (+),score=25.24 TRINITY_DN60023_c0_g1_i1:149-1060(+)